MKAKAANAISIAWLRHELRVHDNLVLDAAAKSGRRVLPVYVFESREFGATSKTSGCFKTGPRRAQFIRECVADLRANLAQRCNGAPLFVGRGDAATILAALSKSLPVDEVFCSQQVCHEELVAEAAVEARTGKKLTRIWDTTMYHPQDCPGQLPASLPDVFTPWRTQVEKNRTPVRACVPPPKLAKLTEAEKPLDLQMEPGFAAGGWDYLPSLLELFPEGKFADEAEASAAAAADLRGNYFDPKGGETAALARVRRYIWEEDRLKDYFETRNGMVGQHYSSKLAPWLARGCVSARRVHAECQAYEKERVANKSTYWLIFELTWRDYFIHYAWKYGRRMFYPYGVKGHRGPQPWRNPARDQAARRDFEAWKSGRTGVPLIDANMRELAATGFMSNRGRQNVASFLVLDLGIDWRFGAEYFEEVLIDYTPEANHGNWHAAAALSGGRVNRFNAVKQGKDYDNDGRHAKLWLPELEKVPGNRIHEPSKWSSQEQNSWGCVLGESYPIAIKAVAFSGPGKGGNADAPPPNKDTAPPTKKAKKRWARGGAMA